MSKFSEFSDGVFDFKPIYAGDKLEALVIDVNTAESVYNLALVIWLNFFAEDGDCYIKGAKISCEVNAVIHDLALVRSSRVRECSYKFELADIEDFYDLLAIVAEAITF